MKYYGKGSMAALVEIILNCTLVIGVAATGLIFYNTLFNMKQNIAMGKKTLVILLLAVGIICVFLIVLELRKVMNTLVNANPFVTANIKSLKRISVECFIIAGCYLINFLFGSNFKEFQFIYVDSRGIHTDMEFIIFIFAGCFIAILSKVFQQAVQYKEESDFTI
ncbi:DUF2975 domain-containing protein [Clostridium sp. DJ247]|uniref:DUF2975 domain-containing protein n=1 Tax=Clostridium sp. DJ247 TaxID=2726188 RepID=UPI001623B6EF|nr:DUF2975 domain-containing protein [Clostridium sp. DJ247]MBC2580198.1 DUF2975 domain-containing protein [Clostridium sp. DJ247]